MKKLLVTILVLGLCGSLFAGGGAQGGASGGAGQMIEGANVPRNQTIILENPGGRCNPPDYFNRWSGWNQTFQSGLQQLTLDALWYIDPDAGVNGVWENALASEKPIYNSDFTQMTINTRRGIYWSDGVEFSIDDVIYTIESQMKNPGMAYTAQFNAYVDRVEKKSNTEAVVHLKSPNSRFHSNFLVRWGACFIMPKHIFEKQADITKFTWSSPIALGPYKLKDFDPQGNWYLYEKRDDWRRTSLALLGSLENAPKYAMYIAAGTSDVKVMTQQAHQIDVIHDMAVEGVITLKRTNPTTKTWFPNFPWGHPDPTLVACMLNLEKPGLNNRDVRWALALALDINRLAMASYRGAMTISALPVPPTGMYPKYYQEPLEPWLENLALDLGDGTNYKPYNTEAAIAIANEARKSLGDMVPTNQADIKKYIGAGWWKYDLKAAEKLMIKGGMRKNSRGIWEFANGQPFKMVFLGQTDNEPSQNRAAAMVVECWKEFGIDVTLQVSANFGDYTDSGDFDGVFYWNIETWGGHPDLSYFLDNFHTNQFVPSGQYQPGRNKIRLKDPRIDRIIDESQKLDMDDPKVITLGQEFCKLWTEEMYEISV
ncbi:MAG: ABC transporter substrate-binding protein, partial [Treponema sp.]|nr:ABC transporter substrate-binding protein [Treponema sp.]